MAILRLALIVVAAWTFSALAGSHAFAAPNRISLADALQALARRGHLSILFRPETVSGITAEQPGKSVSPEAGLEAMLRGTGLRAKRIAPRSFVIERVEQGKAESIGHASTIEVERAGHPSVPSSIVVTALRRPTLLLDTPVSMVVLGGDEWRRFAGRTNADVVKLAPSLAISSPGSGLDRMSLRGVFSAGEPSVGLYYGNVPVLGPSGSSSDPGLMTPNLLLVDVERIEVLRGPQGTLYGAGSLAGTMRVLFRQPELDANSGSVDASVSLVEGGGTGFDASTVVNMVVAPDRAALRAVAYRRREAGFVDNVPLRKSDIGTRDDVGARLSLMWEPEVDWFLSLEGAYQETDFDDFGSSSGDLGTYRTGREVRLPFSSRFWMVSGIVRGALGRADMELSASRYRWVPRRSLDFTRVLEDLRGDQHACAGYFGRLPEIGCSTGELADFGNYLDSVTPAVLDQPLRVTGTSAELRVSGSGKLDWTTGLFFNRRIDSGESSAHRVDGEGMIDGETPAQSLRRFSGALRQFAAFGDLTWHVTDLLDITAGGRYFRYRRYASGESLWRNPATELYGSDAPVSYGYSTRGTAGRIRLDFHPGADWLIYGEVAQGFRPGGVNIIPGLPSEAAVYRGDRIVSRELGSRLSLARDSVQISGALFRQTWSDMEVSAITNNGAFAIISNLGNARIDGFELGLDARAGEHFEARVQTTYLDARLTSNQLSEIAQATGRRGDRLPYVAPLIVSSVLTGRWNLDEGMRLTVGLYGHYTGRHYSRSDRGDIRAMRLGGGGSIDLRASLELAGHSLSVGVSNLTGSHERVWAADTVFAPRTVTRIQPRTVSVGLSSRF